MRLNWPLNPIKSPFYWTVQPIVLPPKRSHPMMMTTMTHEEVQTSPRSPLNQSGNPAFYLSVCLSVFGDRIAVAMITFNDFLPSFFFASRKLNSNLRSIAIDVCVYVCQRRPNKRPNKKRKAIILRWPVVNCCCCTHTNLSLFSSSPLS